MLAVDASFASSCVSPVGDHARAALAQDQLVAPPLLWSEDAEYLATAQLLSCRVVTIDRRLRRGAGHLGYVATPAELVQAN